MVGMNGHMILKCFRKEKRDFRQAALSGDRSYFPQTCILYQSIVQFNGLEF